MRSLILAVWPLVIFAAPGFYTEARADDFKFSIDLSPHSLAGSFDVTITGPSGNLSGKLTLSLKLTGALNGQLALEGQTYTVTGKQAISSKGGKVALTAVSGAEKITFSGALKGAVLSGKTKGPKSGVAAGSGSFTVDLSQSPSLSVYAAVHFTDALGKVAGNGTWKSGGDQQQVAITGKVKQGDAVKKSTAFSVVFKGLSFSFAAKGVALDGGYLVAWKTKSSGVSAAGKNLKIRNTAFPAPPSTVQLVLTDPSTTVFNIPVLSAHLQAAGGTLSTDPADFNVTINGTAVNSAAVEVHSDSITLNPITLGNGENILELQGVDSLGLSIQFVTSLWSGGNTLTVLVQDETGQPTAGAVVRAAVAKHPSIFKEATAGTGGIAVLGNLPSPLFPHDSDKFLVLTAKGSGNRFATALISGTNVSSATLKLIAFDQPSMVDNNDFSNGTSNGWITATPASVTIVPHVEIVGPAAAVVDSDLQLSSGFALAQVPQSVTRTFTIKPDTTAITVRYRFVSQEVHQERLGNIYNDDFFSVTTRTVTGSAIVSENNSVVLLGQNAFDANFSTGWREQSLLVTAGDACQVDITVANVENNLDKSDVIIDKVAETQVGLTIAHPVVTLLGTNHFEVVTPAASAASGFKIEIRRSTGAGWLLLGSQQVLDNYKQRTAGHFKVRGKATIGGIEYASPEQELEVQFPSYAEIVADSVVLAQVNQALASTLAAATAAGRREEGFWILLDASASGEGYAFSTTITGPVAGPKVASSIDLSPMPADNPVNPDPLSGGSYVVASFHTHTPTLFRPAGRLAGPTGGDDSTDRANNVPGVVYDYTGTPVGVAPPHFPSNSPAQLYHSGLDRRPTP